MTHLILSQPKATIEAIDGYVSATFAIRTMNPFELKALMRFLASVPYNKLSSKINTLIDTAASLDFVSKEFAMANDVYKDRKNGPKLGIFEWLVSSVSV